MDFRSCFERIHSSFPIALVNEENKWNIVHALPAFKSFSIASVECTLSSDTKDVDIALGFEKELLTNYIHQWIPEDQKQLTSILNRNHFLNECIRGIWLNYDLSLGRTSRPWAYIILHKINLGQEFNAVLLRQFFQIEVNENPEESLSHILVKALPEHAYILGLSLPHDRNQGAARLVIYGMNAAEIIFYLQNIPSKSDTDLIRKMLLKFDYNKQEIGLIINSTTKKIGDTIGFELLLENQSIDKIESILGELLAHRIIHPEKHQALIQWCINNHTSVPDHGIRCWLNHIKLTFSPQNSWSVKCYFGIQPGYPAFE